MSALTNLGCEQQQMAEWRAASSKALTAKIRARSTLVAAWPTVAAGLQEPKLLLCL